MGLKGFKWYVDPAEITAKVEKFQLLYIWNLPSSRRDLQTVEEKLQQYFEHQEKQLNVDFWYV